MRPTQQLGFAMATAIFIGLITAMSKATAQAYMLFPELGALLGVAITLGLLRLARLTCPPCLGLAILPFVIIHPNGAYPWQALIGMACLVAVVSTTEAWFPSSGARELNP